MNAAAFPPGARHFAFPCRDFVAAVAGRIVAAHGASALREAVVLVPDAHAANDLARALQRAAGMPLLLLPRIATLRTWAAEVAVEGPVMGNAARTAVLYRALSEHQWFDSADLWQVCRELGRLFDELTAERVRLAATRAQFAAWLRNAYGAKSEGSLDFEARLVHDMWTAFIADGSALDLESAYVARLMHLARHRRVPLHVVAPARLTRAEAEFFETYARHAELSVYFADDAGTEDGVAHVLSAAWPRTVEASLKERAAQLARTHPVSPMSGQARIAAAVSAEHEAHIVDLAVRERLLAGKARIAVVVQDRITARRARALLERAGVLVADEAGWALSTTSAATVIARWLDACGGNFYYRDLLDLLKSPFVFADWPRAQRQQAVWRLEARIRSANAIAGLEQYVTLAEKHDDVEARQMLVALRTAAGLMQRRRGTLSQWLDVLHESLAAIGVVTGWSGDAAGIQLLDLLAGLREELRAEKLTIGYGEWRQWLSSQLDNAVFRDHSVESPVVFTYLQALALRRFDAVVIAGVDAAHLPGPDTGNAFFNQGVRAQLGLATREAHVRDTERAVFDVIAGCDDVVLTWQKVRDGEPNLLAPSIERLDALHTIAYGAGLEDDALPARATVARVRTEAAHELPLAAERPAPAVPSALIPAAISASGHNALMACPYQFYARYVLRLAELDEVQELIEKSDYGECVHRALAAFHREHPRIGALSEEQAASELERCTDAAFQAAIGANYLARAWLERWRALIPQYLRWQRGREAEGWHVAESEASRNTSIVTPEGRRLELRGRIDRVDRDEEGRVALIDYKTQRGDRLRAKAAADGEDVQLPFYALLWQEPAAAALFLGMERDGVAGHAVGEDVNRLAEDVRVRLAQMYDRMHAGAAFPAHGVDDVCQYCEAAGLCRKNYWP